MPNRFSASSANTVMYSVPRVMDYPGRLRERADNTKNRKFYNNRKVVTSGKDLTTPIKRGVTAKSKPQPEVKIKVKTISVAKAKLPISIIFYVMGVTCIFLLLIYSHMLLNECVVDIARTRENIEKAQKNELYLTRQVEAKNNLAEFERIAVDELGMIKEDALPKKYVSLKNKDKVQKISSNEDVFAKVTTFFPQFFTASPNE